jgi:hypothetical protein
MKDFTICYNPSKESCFIVKNIYIKRSICSVDGNSLHNRNKNRISLFLRNKYIATECVKDGLEIDNEMLSIIVNQFNEHVRDCSVEQSHHISFDDDEIFTMYVYGSYTLTLTMFQDMLFKISFKVNRKKTKNHEAEIEPVYIELVDKNAFYNLFTDSITRDVKGFVELMFLKFLECKTHTELNNHVRTILSTNKYGVNFNSADLMKKYFHKDTKKQKDRLGYVKPKNKMTEYEKLEKEANELYGGRIGIAEAMAKIKARSADKKPIYPFGDSN